MQDFIAYYYLWFKSFHVIAVICWMAGLLYLPRLFVYHADPKITKATSETFKIMEYRLLKFIMTPAMLLAWLFGMAMIIGNPSLFESGWMPLKFLLVIVMTGVHGIQSKWRRNFAEDANERDAKFYRFANEAPTILMVIIVILAIAEPF